MKNRKMRHLAAWGLTIAMVLGMTSVAFAVGPYTLSFTGNSPTASTVVNGITVDVEIVGGPQFAAGDSITINGLLSGTATSDGVIIVNIASNTLTASGAPTNVVSTYSNSNVYRTGDVVNWDFDGYLLGGFSMPDFDVTDLELHAYALDEDAATAREDLYQKNKDALNLLNSTHESVNGNNVPTNQYWATPEQINALKNAYETAWIAQNNLPQNAAFYEAALDALNAAIALFNSQRQLGLGTVTTEITGSNTTSGSRSSSGDSSGTPYTPPTTTKTTISAERLGGGGSQQTGNYSWRVDLPALGFQSATVGGNELVRGEDYTIRSGSTVLTLTDSYLSTLRPGSYTLHMEFLSATATIDFTVEPTGSSGGADASQSSEAPALTASNNTNMNPSTGR